MQNKTPTFPQLLRHPTHFLAFGAGLGLAPKAPGTFGTLLGIPLYLFLQPLPITTYLAACALLFALGVALCHTTARDLHVHDHPGIVFDEIVGYLVTMTAAPQGWPWIAAGFALFRLFDIWKPWPIRVADRHVAGGFGIMLDDLLAGIYAGLVLYGATQALS